MEQKDIKYTGITQATSDLDCNDGELSISHNMINHNGAMRPVILPNPEFTLKAGETLLYIHSASNYRNFIYQQANSIKAFTIVNNARKEHDLSYNLKNGEAITKIESIGNTLILLTSSRLSYILFKENSYKYLGEKPEFPEIRFELNGTIQKSEEKGVGFDINLREPTKFDDDQKKKATIELLGEINKQLKESRDKGMFTFPFFIRYALRLYDGNYAKQSAPILILPSSSNAIVANITREDGKYIIQFSSGTLQYSIQSYDSDWNDIITAADIFISSPIYTYDQNGEVIGTVSRKNTRKTYGFFIDGSFTRADNKRVGRWEWNHVTDDAVNFDIPLYTIEKINESIVNNSIFYKIHSIDLNEDTNAGEPTPINLEDGALNALEVRERLKDDYQSHCKLVPNYSYVYNSRLNIANITKTYFNGFKANQMSLNHEPYPSIIEFNYTITVYIKNENGITTKVYNTSSSTFYVGTYLFYPDPNAYKMIITRSQGSMGITTISVNLKEHPFLNGAYWWGGFPDNENWFDDMKGNYIPPEESNKTVYLPNKLYTSQVGNPFLFPLEGINTIGVGQIIGMSSTTRALSQGQFGQFPLLVFATDGIWAMEVSSNGLYSVKQPISRDVCSNPASITQIDGAVIFISSKGAMMVNAGEVNTFSAELDGPSFIPSSIIKLDEIATKESLTTEISGIIPVKDFLSGCQIAYDYPNAQLLFINKDKPYAYVYSLESRSWATVTSSFIRVVSDYPHSYLQNSQEGVVNISSKMDYDDQSRVKSLILSRPIKFGDDIYKTVNQLINRGNFSADRINVVLFASTDGSTYFPIGSAIGPQLSRLQGSPYKYFRIAIIANFTAKESLSITSVAFTPKWRNKLR